MIRSNITLPSLTALALGMALSACGSQSEPAEAPAPEPAAAPPAAAAEAPPAPGVHGGAPAMPQAPAASSQQGTVQETMDASSYTYMRVETAQGSVWVAAMQMPVNVGDRVEFSGSVMPNFHSSTLDRTFETLVLANSAHVLGADGQPTAPPGHAPGNGPRPLDPGETQLPPGHPPIGMDAPTAVPPAAAMPAPSAPAAPSH